MYLCEGHKTFSPQFSVIVWLRFTLCSVTYHPLSSVLTNQIVAGHSQRHNLVFSDDGLPEQKKEQKINLYCHNNARKPIHVPTCSLDGHLPSMHTQFPVCISSSEPCSPIEFWNHAPTSTSCRNRKLQRVIEYCSHFPGSDRWPHPLAFLHIHVSIFQGHPS
jgi:hypothetical protein